MSHLYRQLTWPDVREAMAQKKVILIPVAAIEQHDYHLPIDMDFCYDVGHSLCPAGLRPDHVRHRPRQ